MPNDTKEPPHNGGTSNFKKSSISSMASNTIRTATAISTDPNTDSIKTRLTSVTDDEIIQKNLKELMDKKSREERKANGRLVAVILAALVIFLAIYHAWIRNSGLLAGVLVPAIIMLSFGGWVVILAKRDKAKRQIFEKCLEEMAIKNKQELEAKSKTKTKKSHDRTTTTGILLHYENEINKQQLPQKHKALVEAGGAKVKNNNHRKHRKHRKNSDVYSTTSSTSSKISSHYATKDLRIKRPSIRQKLFRQTGIYHMPGATGANATHTLVQAVINTPLPPQCASPPVAAILIQQQTPVTLIETKRKRLQRLDALQVPTMVRMSSAP